MTHKWLSASVLAVAVFLLSACGFYLKGHQDYAFKRLYIAPSGMTSPAMLARLKRMIQSNGKTLVVNHPREADATLSIDQARSRNTLSINIKGLIDEYELILSLNYSLTSADGTLLIPPSALLLNRAMTYNDRYALAKEAEADLFYSDMESDAADQLIRRLAAVRSLEADKALPAIRSGTPSRPLL